MYIEDLIFSHFFISVIIALKEEVLGFMIFFFYIICIVRQRVYLFGLFLHVKLLHLFLKAKELIQYVAIVCPLLLECFSSLVKQEIVDFLISAYQGPK